MAHPYAVQPVIPANGIQNGSMVTFVTEAGAVSTEKRSPDVNQYVTSGVMNVRTSGRFDEHYGGGAS
jgi:quercetin dioxygenase-like cupin family protein